MLPGKRDFYRCCKQRVVAAISKYAPPSLRVIRTRFARTIIYNIYIHDSRLNRPESVSLASLARQLTFMRKLFFRVENAGLMGSSLHTRPTSFFFQNNSYSCFTKYRCCQMVLKIHTTAGFPSTEILPKERADLDISGRRGNETT